MNSRAHKMPPRADVRNNNAQSSNGPRVKRIPKRNSGGKLGGATRKVSNPVKRMY